MADIYKKYCTGENASKMNIRRLQSFRSRLLNVYYRPNLDDWCVCSFSDSSFILFNFFLPFDCYVCAMCHGCRLIFLNAGCDLITHTCFQYATGKSGG